MTRHKKSNKIDQTILSYSEIYNKYYNAKEKFKRLIVQRTPTIVAIDINASVALNRVESSTIESSISSVVGVNTTSNLPVHRRQINFNNYLDNKQPRNHQHRLLVHT